MLRCDVLFVAGCKPKPDVGAEPGADEVFAGNKVELGAMTGFA
jgi:hypothetical protein